MLKKAALILISLALAAFLLSQIDVREVWRVVVDFPPKYLAAAFTSFVLGHLVRAVRFKVLLRADIPMKSLFHIIAVQTAAIVYLPLRAGEFSLMYMLKKEHGVEYPVGAAILILSKALDFLVVVSLFFVSISALPVVPEFYRELMPWAGALFFATVASLFLMGRSREIYARMPNWFREGPLAEGVFMTNVKKVFKGAEVIRSKETLALSLLVTALLWVLLYGSNFFVLWGVGLDLTVMQMIFLTTSMTLFANIPIHSPGGLGTMEAFWTLLLVALGSTKDMAIATGFASHLVTFAFSLVFLLYGYRLLIRQKEEAP
ncbi:MAG: flippase-like domain-containing protein [Nitrospirae bacterium]|nr:flippase-like domain-containing protein [Nitrospirota bacterium]